MCMFKMDGLSSIYSNQLLCIFKIKSVCFFLSDEYQRWQYLVEKEANVNIEPAAFQMSTVIFSICFTVLMGLELVQV